MKKALLLLIALLLFSASSAFAQKRKLSYTDDTYGDVVAETPEIKSYNLTAGQMFQRASKEFLICGAGAIVSGGLCGVAASLEDKDTRNAVFIAGGIVGLASVAMGVKGCITLGKAGKILDQQRPVAYLKPASTGIGINLTF